jgi:hypothetical protein
VPDIPTLEATIAPWEQERNDRHATVDWRFTTPAARTKVCFWPFSRASAL